MLTTPANLFAYDQQRILGTVPISNLFILSDYLFMGGKLLTALS